MQDKLFNKIQNELHRNKKINAGVAEFLLKNPNSTADQQEKYKTLLSASLAKGGKLRPTSEQMLLDNQKLVAKAIEKMNDNTMKLILKALS